MCANMLVISFKRLIVTLVCLVTGLGIVSVLKLETTAQTLTNSTAQRAETAQMTGVVEPGRNATYPPQLLQVFPPEKSIQTDVQSIGAKLNFKLGEGGDLGSLRLFVDGVDVTPQARIANTRDWPSSHVEISYTPNFSERDTHCAEVRFQSLEGKPISHNWCFAIEPSSR